MFRDQTAHRAAALELERLSARLQSILHANPDIIIELDARKTYTWSNGAGIEFFGDDVLSHE